MNAAASRFPALGWLACLLLVLLVHVALAAALLHWPQTPPPAASASPGLRIELAPAARPPRATAAPAQAAPAEVRPVNTRPRPSPPRAAQTPPARPTVSPAARTAAVVSAPPAAAATVAAVTPAPANTPAPTAAPTAAPAASPTAALQQAPQADWQQRLLGHLQRYQQYPREARRQGLEGRNRLRFVISAEGLVLEHALVDRADSSLFDRATLAMLEAAQPLPAPPGELLDNGRLEISVPIVYSLRQH